MKVSVEDIMNRVKLLSKHNPAYTEIVKWTGEMLCNTVRISKSDDVFDETITEQTIPEAWFKGSAFLELGKMEMDWDQAISLYRNIALSAAGNDSAQNQFKALLSIMDKNSAEETIGLFRAALSSDFQIIEETAEQAGIDPALFLLMLRLALRPEILHLAETASEILDFNHWHFGHCPVCGSAPGLAQLSDDNGKRMLHCALCETEWPYSRIGCPFCENCEVETLQYLFAENEEGWRIYECSKCNQYLKTIDLRIIPGPVILLLDDVATWHLNLIASGDAVDLEKAE